MPNNTTGVKLGAGGRTVAAVLGTVLFIGGIVAVIMAVNERHWEDVLPALLLVSLGGTGIWAARTGRAPLV